jgi:hypothetical protein
MTWLSQRTATWWTLVTTRRRCDRERLSTSQRVVRELDGVVAGEGLPAERRRFHTHLGCIRSTFAM